MNQHQHVVEVVAAAAFVLMIYFRAISFRFITRSFFGFVCNDDEKKCDDERKEKKNQGMALPKQLMDDGTLSNRGHYTFSHSKPVSLAASSSMRRVGSKQRF